MATNHWYYEKLDKDGKLKRAPMHDENGKVTGKHIINLKCWFDENPAERIRLGWIKHYTKTRKELKEEMQWDPQTQFLVSTAKMVDEYTCEDEYHIVNKSEQQLAFEEMQSVGEWGENLVWGYDEADGPTLIM